MRKLPSGIKPSKRVPGAHVRDYSFAHRPRMVMDYGKDRKFTVPEKDCKHEKVIYICASSTEVNVMCKLCGKKWKSMEAYKRRRDGKESPQKSRS